MAKGLLASQAPPIKVDVKELDDKSFGIFAQAINDPNFSVDMQNVLEFLKACLVWCVPTFVESTVQFLVQRQCPPRDTIIAAVRLGCEYRTNHFRAMDVLEHHIASQPEGYLEAEEFAKLPFEAILRIFTWYNEPVPSTPEFFNFVMRMFHVVGTQATLLLELVDLSKVPAGLLAQLRDVYDLIDLEIVGDKILRELRPLQRETDRERVASLKTAILDAQTEKARLVRQYEAATRGLASMKKKCKTAADELKRMHALKDRLNEKMERLNQERQKLEAQVAELVEKRKAAAQEKEADKKEHESQKEQLKEQKAEPAAPEASAPPPEPEKPVEPEAPAPEPEPEPVPEPEPAKQELVVEPAPTKAYLKIPEELFKLEEFLPRMANLKAEDLTIFLPEELIENLTRSDEARAVYLDYLWRNVEMKSRDAIADYGALLAAQESESDDLAISLLKYAVEKGSPDAMFNLAVMMKNERGGLKATNDEIAKLLVDAANGGLEAAQHVMEKAQ